MLNRTIVSVLVGPSTDDHHHQDPEKNEDHSAEKTFNDVEIVLEWREIDCLREWGRRSRGDGVVLYDGILVLGGR